MYDRAKNDEMFRSPTLHPMKIALIQAALRPATQYVEKSQDNTPACRTERSHSTY